MIIRPLAEMKRLSAKRFLLFGFPAFLHAGFNFSLSFLSEVPEFYPEVVRLDRVLHPVSTSDRHLRCCVEQLRELEGIVGGPWTR